MGTLLQFPTLPPERPPLDTLSFLATCAHCPLAETCRIPYGAKCPPGTPGASSPADVCTPTAGELVQFPKPRRARKPKPTVAEMFDEAIDLLRQERAERRNPRRRP